MFLEYQMILSNKYLNKNRPQEEFRSCHGEGGIGS
jgi:hypothetical protein